MQESLCYRNCEAPLEMCYLSSSALFHNHRAKKITTEILITLTYDKRSTKIIWWKEALNMTTTLTSTDLEMAKAQSL